MDGFLFQDWTTVSSDATSTLVAQSEDGWLDLLDYRDIVFWLDVKSITLGGAAAIAILLETSPSKDERLFMAMDSFPLSLTTTPLIRKVLEAQNPAVPVCQWVRWRLQAAGPATKWGVTFRLHCAANRGGIG